MCARSGNKLIFVGNRIVLVLVIVLVGLCCVQMIFRSFGNLYLTDALVVEGKPPASFSDPLLFDSYMYKPLLVDGSRRLAFRAVQSFSQALKIYPDDLQLYERMGKSAILAHDLQTSARLFNHLVKVNPTDAYHSWLLGLGYEYLSRESELTSAVPYIKDPSEAAQKAVDVWLESGRTSTEFIILAQTAGQKQHYDESLIWYRRASNMMKRANPDVFSEVQSDNFMIMDDFENDNVWSLCSWCDNSPGFVETNAGILTFSYDNQYDKRDIFALVTSPYTALDNYKYILLRLKGVSGTRITLDITLDDGLQRVLSYHNVPETWTVLREPIHGQILKNIILSISESTIDQRTDKYSLSVDWIILE